MSTREKYKINNTRCINAFLLSNQYFFTMLVITKIDRDWIQSQSQTVKILVCSYNKTKLLQYSNYEEMLENILFPVLLRVAEKPLQMLGYSHRIQHSASEKPSKAHFQCYSCWMYEMQLNTHEVLLKSCFHAALKHIWHALKCH